MRTIEEIAYERYKSDWLISRGYTLEDLCTEMLLFTANSERVNIETEARKEYKIWEMDRGMGGELYACFDEFLNCEYQDKEYMRTILTDREFEEYCKEM
ncbi:MAG: hypothetical protein Q4B26_00910 [Eubacteriales bacterium]|nr:hypothetical protein [Eubacteriales bacterium]